jgi:NAD(P)H-dependent FMN reductase
MHTETLNLRIIYGTAREGRFCDTVAEWSVGSAAADPQLNVQLLDPRSIYGARQDRIASSAETKAHLATADAFLVVTPEYNHGYPAVLKRLIDSFDEEWHAKPVAFVSYGGISGGPVRRRGQTPPPTTR